MNVFDRITKSPQALADFLQAIPAINAPWDDAFHRIYCDQCAAENCDNCPNGSPSGQRALVFDASGGGGGNDTRGLYADVRRMRQRRNGRLGKRSKVFQMLCAGANVRLHRRH
ncbi:MAG: hypothetical protein ACLS3C_11075 [Oscillospiraceae bacterium]